MKVPCVLVALSLVVVSQARYYDVTMLEALDRMSDDVLIGLLKTAGLDGIFTDLNSNVTLFAPTDRAFYTDLRNLGLDTDDLENDIPKLKSILTYHVLQGRHKASEFTNERLFTAVSGDKLRTNHYLANNRYYVDGAYISNGNIETKNGVIFSVSHILFPFQGTVYDIIANDTDLSTLKAAIDAAGLQGFLADQNPITIFCPTNDAFSQLGDLVNKVLADKTLLTTILTYHVVPGSLYRGGMHDGAFSTFDAKDQIILDHHYTFDELNDDARFKKYDISASNGVVHKLDAVLVPDSVEDQIKNLSSV